MIHVCFGLHDKTGRYSKFTGTTMLSIFANTASDVTVHLLHDNTLTQNNREKFSLTAEQYNQRVKFYNVDELCAEKINKMVDTIPSAKTSCLSVAALYRLLIPQLLPEDIEKAVYLDSDIVVNMDVNELWRIELDDKPIAAADEVRADSFYHPNNAKANYLVTDGFVDYDDYFNSGVLSMNLKILRKENEHIMDGVTFVGEHPQLKYLDQEVLNYIFSKRYLKLDEKFNSFVRKARRHNEDICYRRIYHFAGKGLYMNMADIFNRLWMNYFAKTPWFDAETIEHLYAGVQQFNINVKQSMVNLTVIMSGKTRGFFVAPNNVDGLKNFFSVRDDEEIIPAENNDSLRKLLDAMNVSRGKKIFFIMLPNFPFRILTQAGFVQGRDFLNGFEFLSEAQGVPLNSYELIKAM